MREILADHDPEVHLLFLPHIFSDLTIVSDVIARLSDRLRRTRISCAPYVTGPAGAKHVFGLYRDCHVILAMRFHANVCALGMGIPVIGLCNYPQIDWLYKEINRPGGCLSVRSPGYSVPLLKMITAALAGSKSFVECAEIIESIACLLYTSRCL